MNADKRRLKTHNLSAFICVYLRLICLFQQPAKEPDPKADDITEVRREEGSRGKRGPAAISARKREASLRRNFRKLLERGTEADFYAAMRALGVPVDSPQFREALKIWQQGREL
jgi:hypothetical protein